MIGLVIYWDIHPDMVDLMGGAKRWLSTYIFAIEAFGADKLFIVGKPGISHGYNIQHTEHETFGEIICDNPDAKIVALVGATPENIVPHLLSTYTHPTADVIYVIGGDYSDIDFGACVDIDVDYLHIDNLISSSVLWSNTVAGIVLRDRYVKSL